MSAFEGHSDIASGAQCVPDLWVHALDVRLEWRLLIAAAANRKFGL